MIRANTFMHAIHAARNKLRFLVSHNLEMQYCTQPGP